MIKNYLKISFRNLAKNKVYSFINIFGLTLGLTSFLLIALYIFDELTFDRFHKNADNTYRVIEHKVSPEGKETKVAAVAYNISAQAKTVLPEMIDAARFSMLGRVNVSNNENDKVFYEDFNLADESFFKVFGFTVAEGDAVNALQSPNSVIITEETAEKIFGSKSALGKTISVDRDSLPYKVTAVLKDIPANSHLKFNMVFSESSLQSQRFKAFINSDWSSNTFVTYIHLRDGVNIEQAAAKINQIAASHRKPDQQGKSDFILQPLTGIHFYSQGIEGDFGNGNIFYIYVFSVLALFVLVIACINYVNLTTARFANRAKEIAVRKVAGAFQKDLVCQFLSEAFVVTIIALLLALSSVKLILPSFNTFVEKKLSLGTSTDYRIWIGIAAITILVSLLSGTYPAFFQSGLKPYLLLKNKLDPGRKTLSLRKALVIFQFTLSIVMIVSTLVVYQQLRYINTKDLGFRKDQLVVIDINSGSVRRSAETIKDEFAKLSSVKNVSTTSRVPGEWKVIPKIKIRQPGNGTESNDAYIIGADEKFLSTFEVVLLKGRNFTNSPADSSAVMLNETAANILGIKQPADQQIEIPSAEFSGNTVDLKEPFKARVIGITKDFNFRSLREKVAPMVIAYKNNPVQAIDYFTLRVSANNMDATIKKMEGVIAKIDPNHLFEYNFLDKKWDEFYREDQKRQSIFIAIAFMTILIACLGLFGLATYSSEQRIKEIGIRKVLGASVSSIVSMLSKDFLKLVLIATIIAIPLSWLAMYNWLQDFAYRINISWWVFAVGGLMALLIALITVSFQSIKAAIANPVKSLRTE